MLEGVKEELQTDTYLKIGFRSKILDRLLTLV